MFLVDIRYTQALSEIDKYLPAHIKFLDAQYADGTFLLSGKKEPRTGGIILAKANCREAMLKVIQQDPFYQAKLANYSITEFTPSKATTTLEPLL